MFRKAKNIDTSFREMRLVALVCIAASLIVSGYIAYKSFEASKSAQGKIYVLYNEQAIAAFASDRKDNIPVQAKSHIKNFHKAFFTLSPDDKYIQKTISEALYLADNSAKRQYDNLREANYYIGIVSGNVSTSVSCDSIALDLNTSPYGFTFYGKQEITRPTSVVVRNLITMGYLREVRQSDNNPHGFLIERWKVVDNKDLSIKNR